MASDDITTMWAPFPGEKQPNRAIGVNGAFRGWVGYVQRDKGSGNFNFYASCKAHPDDLLTALAFLAYDGPPVPVPASASEAPRCGTLYEVYESLRKTLPAQVTAQGKSPVEAWFEATVWQALVAARRSCKFNLLADEELSKARDRHGSFQSYHHFASVIREEYEEFWDIVKQKSEKRDREAALKELVQIAASCRRAAEDLKLVE